MGSVRVVVSGQRSAGGVVLLGVVVVGDITLKLELL